MGDLELVKLHEDGEHLVLAAKDGSRFMLPISEELRAAVRRDRAHLEHLRAGSVALPPREIQTRLRAGQSAEAVATVAGISLDQVTRYAGPVIAEQEYIVEQAMQSRHAGDHTLKDLVRARLEARAADPGAVVWSATREGGSPWLVTALFEVNDSVRSAQWTYRPATRALTPIDDEARWLSTQNPEPLVPEEPVDPPAIVDVRPPPPEPSPETDQLLAALSLRRGVRTPIPEWAPVAGPDFLSGDSPESLDSQGADVVAFPGRRFGDTGVEESPTDPVPDPSHRTPEPMGCAPTEGELIPPPAPASKGRLKVPSLDEIVFGAKPRP